VNEEEAPFGEKRCPFLRATPAGPPVRFQARESPASARRLEAEADERCRRLLFRLCRRSERWSGMAVYSPFPENC